VAPTGDFDDREPAPDSLALPVRAQREELTNMRAFGLVGHRNVWWVRRRGLDSMRGQEDVRLGAEAILALGRSLPSVEVDDDLYGMLGVYSAFELGDGLVIPRARRRAPRPGRACQHARVGGRLRRGGAARLPPDAVAAPADAVLPRGRHRRLEHAHAVPAHARRRAWPARLRPRAAARRPPHGVHPRRPLLLRLAAAALLDLGGTVFADVGRVWPGDAPFGVDSGWRTSIGIGLRGSFPAGSRSTYRLDFAWPTDRGTSLRDFRITMSVGEWRGINPRETDRQIVRSRTQNVGGDLFTFRN
jgi:hypothetical protein